MIGDGAARKRGLQQMERVHAVGQLAGDGRDQVMDRRM
jgi:hypothetical protein